LLDSAKELFGITASTRNSRALLTCLGWRPSKLRAGASSLRRPRRLPGRSDREPAANAYVARAACPRRSLIARIADGAQHVAIFGREGLVFVSATVTQGATTWAIDGAGRAGCTEPALARQGARRTETSATVMASSRSHVHFTSQSGQRADVSACPLSAKTGLKLRRGCTPSASRERLRLRPDPRRTQDGW
jgi:hypothetical protein